MADTNVNNQSIKIICPSANELSVIINNVKCNQCGLVFKNESRFRFHHVKIHQRKKLEKMDKMETTHYHCPEKTCIYSPTSSRFFTTMKYLKQVCFFFLSDTKVQRLMIIYFIFFFLALFEGACRQEILV